MNGILRSFVKALVVTFRKGDLPRVLQLAKPTKTSKYTPQIWLVEYLDYFFARVVERLRQNGDHANMQSKNDTKPAVHMSVSG